MAAKYPRPPGNVGRKTNLPADAISCLRYHTTAIDQLRPDIGPGNGLMNGAAFVAFATVTTGINQFFHRGVGFVIIKVMRFHVFLNFAA